MTEPHAAAVDAPAAKPAAVWEDFVDVFTSPSAVFARRRDGQFGKALLILMVLSTATFFATRPLLQPMFDRMFDAQQAAMAQANPNMTEEQRASAKAMTERIGTVFVPIFAVVGVPILVFVTAGVLMGTSRVAGAPVSFGQAATITTYAQVPRILGGIAGAAILAVKDAQELPVLQSAPTGPVLFLSRDASPYLVAVLSRFDLFTLWSTVLIGIGVAVMARRDRGKGFTAAGLLWLVASLWTIVSAFRQAAAMGG
jgi:hypothetical protein